MRIGIDCDDVCADFQKAFVSVLFKLHGKPPLGTAPMDWMFSNSGLSQAQIDKGWDFTRTVMNFWANLEPLASFDAETVDLLNNLLFRHDVYFITNRYETAGSSPMKQTKYWFFVNAHVESPNVIIAKDKGPVATMLELDAFADDRPKNCLDVLAARPDARVYLVDSSHNQDFNDPRIPRVKDLKEFLKLILEAN